MIAEHLKQQMKQHALNEAPLEACGVVFKGEYFPTRNIADSGEFKCHMDDVPTDDIDELEWVFHSHTNGNNSFSASDITHCNVCGVPYVLYSTASDEFLYLQPVEDIPEYVGRVYVAGIQDCYSLVQDYYKKEYSITLPDVDRWECWWKDGVNLIANNVWEDMGFHILQNKKEIKQGDVIVMQSGSKYPDHLAIYLGDEKILHHCYNRLSNIELYSGMWLKNTVYVLRRSECKNQQSSSEGS